MGDGAFGIQAVPVIEIQSALGQCLLLADCCSTQHIQGPVAAPASNHYTISERSASVIPVALFMGMSFCTTACW